MEMMTMTFGTSKTTIKNDDDDNDDVARDNDNDEDDNDEDDDGDEYNQGESLRYVRSANWSKVINSNPKREGLMTQGCDRLLV